MSFKKQNGIIINTDDTYFNALKSSREAKQEIQSLQEHINNISSELSEIKALLIKALNK